MGLWWNFFFWCLNRSKAFPDITGAARVCACRKNNQEPNTPSCKAALAGRKFSMLTTSQELLRSPIHFPCRKPILFTPLLVWYILFTTYNYGVEKTAAHKTKQPKHLLESATAKHSLMPAELAESARLNTCLGPKNAGWQDCKVQHAKRAAGTQLLRLYNEFYQSVDLVWAERKLNVCIPCVQLKTARTLSRASVEILPVKRHSTPSSPAKEAFHIWISHQGPQKRVQALLFCGAEEVEGVLLLFTEKTNRNTSIRPLLSHLFFSLKRNDFTWERQIRY